MLCVHQLLRFESSRGEPGELISLDDYVGRMSPEQHDEVYWLLAPTRDSALSSAYMEAFKAKVRGALVMARIRYNTRERLADPCDSFLIVTRTSRRSCVLCWCAGAQGVEVLLLYSTVDEFVMNNLMNYGGKSIVSAEAAKLDLSNKDDAGLSEEEANALKAWMVESIDGVKEVKLSAVRDFDQLEPHDRCPSRTRSARNLETSGPCPNVVATCSCVLVWTCPKRLL